MATSAEARRLEQAIEEVERANRSTQADVQTLASKLGTLEIAVAKHAGVCDERYLRINEHLESSKTDRLELRRMFRNLAGTIILLLLSIIGFMLARFGLPPAIHP